MSEKLTSHSFVVIPYYDGDRGARPLPSGVPSFACQSISINGSVGGTIKKNDINKISVTVANYGDYNGLQGVNLYLDFVEFGTSSNQRQRFGHSSFQIMAPGGIKTETFTGFMGNVSDHLCFLAWIVGVGDDDTDPKNPQPGTDRHWAQHNATAVMAHADRRFSLRFVAGNTTRERDTFLIEVKPIEPEALANYNRIANTHHQPADIADIVLDDIRNGPQSSSRLEISLAPEETHHISLSGRLLNTMPGHSYGIEVVQTRLYSGEFIGSCGVFIAVT